MSLFFLIILLWPMTASRSDENRFYADPLLIICLHLSSEMKASTFYHIKIKTRNQKLKKTRKSLFNVVIV